MKCKWLLETDKFSENIIPQLTEEIKRQNMEVVFADRQEYLEGQTFKDIYAPEDCVLFYGSLEFSWQIQKETKWVPGSFHNPKNYTCSAYYPYFSKYLLAEEYMIMPFGDILNKKEFIFNVLGQENTVFIRPNSGEKPFTGQLLNCESIENELPKLGYVAISDNELVVFSPPRNIEVEWRFVVADHEVITGSRYLPFRLRLADNIEDRQSEKFAREVVEKVKWIPDRMWCLDVCLTRGGQYRVIEINSFSCSGLYACDPKPIVEYGSKLAVEEWENVYNI